MKKTLTLLFLATISLSFLSGCSETVDNRITFKNDALYKVYVNFRASLITVEPGSSAYLTNVPKGTYTYETTFEVPSDPDITATMGNDNLSGEVNITAGTKILIYYTSTQNADTYTIFATITTSDDLTTDNPVSP